MLHAILNGSNVENSVWFILRPCQHDDGYIDGRSQIKVDTDERTQVHNFTALDLPQRSSIQVFDEVDVA